MNKLVFANPTKCIGCRTCEISCVLAHAEPNALSTLSLASFKPRLTVVKTATITTAVQCRQCDDAPCAAVCPTGALVLSNDFVQVIQNKCIGCKSCVMACRFGAIELTPHELGGSNDLFATGKRSEVVKCDLCEDRAKGPACIEVCPMDAISIVDAAVLAEATHARQQHAASMQMAANTDDFPRQAGA